MRSTAKGFTLVELIIVIVVIAILAAIAIVAYRGVTQQAQDSSLRADLQNAAKQLEAYNVQNGSFPNSSVQQAGVKTGPGVSYTYTYNPGDNSYCLVATKGSLYYTISSQQTSPGQYNCISTLAGGPNGESGYQDATGTAARFTQPSRMALGGDGKLYLIDRGPSAYIRKIDPVTAQVSTVYTTTSSSSLDSLAVAADGTIYAVFVYDNCIRRITGPTTTADLACGYPALQEIRSITVGADGNIYGIDAVRCVVVKVNKTGGAVSILAGTAGQCSYQDGSGAGARFSYPQNIATAPDGNFYVTDGDPGRIRKVAPSGVTTTVAGSGASIISDGAALQAGLGTPYGLTVDGNGTVIFVSFADDGSGQIRMLKNNTVTTVAGGYKVYGSSGVAASPSQANVFYIASYTDRRVYKVQ